MVFTTEELLEVAIESWPERDLNPQPLNSVQTLSGHEFNWHSEPTLYIYSSFAQRPISFCLLPSSVATFI